MKTYYNGQRSRRRDGTESGTQGERKSSGGKIKTPNDIRSENNYL